MKETFKTLNIIYLALIGGQLAFFAVVFFVLKPAPQEDDFFQMLVPIVSIMTIVASFFIYKMLKEKATEMDSLEDKVTHYRTSNIVRYALVEGGNLFAIVVFLLTGQTFLLAFFALGLIVFFFYRPSVQGFINDFEMSDGEASKLNNIVQ